MAGELSLLKSTVADVLGLQGTVAEEQANAEAEQLKNQGAAGEIGAYDTAAQIAEKNAQLEGVFGDIQEFQIQRQVGKSTGTQAAEIAGSGFSSNSGTAVALLRESLQQGYLSEQLNRTQTTQNQGGYLEQASAARAEGGAVQAQISASNRLAEAEQNAASIASANAANESKALQDFITKNPAQTPEEQQQRDLVTSTLSSPLNGPAQLPTSTSAALGTDGQLSFNGQGWVRLPSGTSGGTDFTKPQIVI